MTGDVLIHYSRNPLQEVWSVPAESQNDHFKPCGLWVSVQGPDDWLTWCQNESYSLENLLYAHRIMLSEKAKILRISDACGIDELTRKFSGREVDTEEFYEVMARGGRPNYRLDWQRIAESYDGIIIAPYVWERRLASSTMWYYSWDCASGCIWNASAIQEFIHLTSEPSEI